MNTTAKTVEILNKAIQWSEEQIAIFAWFAFGIGHMIVRARAGTGKTFTITEGFAYVPANITKILYCVFNKKNQVEAEKKIKDKRVSVKTLHAIGFNIILKFWKGMKPDNFLERERIETVCPGIPSEVITQACKLVGFLKNLYITPTLDDIEQTMNARDIACPDKYNEWDSRLPEIALQALELAKTRDNQNRISFDDMVWLPVAMGWVKPEYELIVVDECQDMNLPQLTMATGLVLSQGRVCLVGDDRQAIYGFRGAASNGIDMFKEKLNASETSLTVTRRCPKKVMNIAKTFVPDYKAHDSAPDGEVVNALSASKLNESVIIGDAVLSRKNAPLMAICLSLLRKGISARIEGRDIGKTLCNIVKEIRAKSVPDFLTKLVTWEEKQIKRAKGKTAQSRIEMVQDQSATLRTIAEVASSVSDIETRLNSLFQDSEYATKPAVVCSTVHKAKGLEWTNVYLLSDTFQSRAKTEQERLEEQNVYYVAVTRAKSKLVFVQGMPQQNPI